MDLSSINFVDLLERVGLRNVHMTSSGVEVNYSCHRPEHNHGDENPSAYLNSVKGKFFCWGCKFCGDVAELVADVQQVSQREAERFLRDTYGMDFDEPIGGSMLAEFEARLRPPAPKPIVARPPESWLSSARLDWFASDLEPFQNYMLDRGLSRFVLDEFQIGYDFLSDRITIPVRDLDGELFGIKGRDWCGSHPAKYLVLGERPSSRKLCYGFGTYEVSEVVFGLHRARETRWGVLLEGELDTIALYQMGVPRPISTGGARMSHRQARLIVDELEEVVVLYDSGQAGEEGTRQVVELLEPHIHVRVSDPLDMDPCDALRLGAHVDMLRAIQRARSSLAFTSILV